LGAPPSCFGDARAVIELARYREGPATVVVSRDGDELLFWSSHDDYGRTITEESRIDVASFVAKGEGPWPWYDLGDKRDGTLMVLDALGADPGRGLDALRPWWATTGARYAGYRADEVADIVAILRTGGAAVTDRHRELAADAGASQVEAALRR
jgi:hypothetical protein